jgi:hypothetical protein
VPAGEPQPAQACCIQACDRQINNWCWHTAEAILQIYAEKRLQLHPDTNRNYIAVWTQPATPAATHL